MAETVYTSMDILERMAFAKPGREIRRYGEVACLVIGDKVWTAKLSPAGGVSRG